MRQARHKIRAAGPAPNATANGAENPAPSAAGNFTAPAKLGLAETLLRENQTAAAADAFAAYLQAAPSDRAARFERSVALQDLGRLDEALAELDRADARRRAIRGFPEAARQHLHAAARLEFGGRGSRQSAGRRARTTPNSTPGKATRKWSCATMPRRKPS